MAVESGKFTELADEFELIAETAAGAGAALLRGEWTGPLAEADLATAAHRVPHIRVITIPGAGADVAATQPAALAAALGQLLTTEEARQR